MSEAVSESRAQEVRADFARYPLPPWVLRGEALCVVRLAPTSLARSLCPATLRIAPVLPGRTLALLALVRYGPGSTLTYHELIVAPALVYGVGRLGFWVSHIYVDDLASAAAGRAEWGLPKELARFSWTARGARMEHDQLSVEITRTHRPAAARAPLYAPVFGGEAHALRWSVGQGKFHVGRSPGSVVVQADASVERLGFQSARGVFSVNFNVRLEPAELLRTQ